MSQGQMAILVTRDSAQTHNEEVSLSSLIISGTPPFYPRSQCAACYAVSCVPYFLPLFGASLKNKGATLCSVEAPLVTPRGAVE